LDVDGEDTISIINNIKIDRKSYGLCCALKKIRYVTEEGLYDVLCDSGISVEEGYGCVGCGASTYLCWIL
jgi:hypothetical protein